MNKNIIKRILNLIDTLEINKTSIRSLISQLEKELILQFCETSRDSIEEVIRILQATGNLKTLEDGIDLSQPATVYAKSYEKSECEAAALFECCIREMKYRQVLLSYLDLTFHPIDLMADLGCEDLVYLMQNSILFIEVDEALCRFNPNLKQYIEWVLEDYENKRPIISSCVRALYTRDIYRAKKKLEMRNTDYKMIAYDSCDVILDILPAMGIPVDRDESKELQTFFKDCLFNEFNHCCAICGIHLPQMLIASHIKPFRDCAHVYEAMDNNNGLLLCRNHDYLFDQGYISFEENGQLIICSELLNDPHFKAYGINTAIRLKERYCTQSRVKFFKYHKKNYFRKQK